MGSGNSGQRRAGDQGSKELQNIEARCRIRVTKRHIAGVVQEIQAHSAYKRRPRKLTEALGTCFRQRGAESGVESFEESISLVILLRM